MSGKLARRAECRYSWGSGRFLRNLTLGEAGVSGDLLMVIVFGLKCSESYHIWHESAVQVFILASAVTVLVSWPVRIMKWNVGNSVVPATGSVGGSPCF